jgi:1-acyl-sn-glycerol-3-phosphate acyltransferase
MAKRQAGQFYPVARAILKPTFAFTWNLMIEGIDNVPETGPAIIAPNHISVLDSFFLPAVLPRRITYVGKAEYMDSWKTRYLFPALGMIPIDRSGGDSATAALDAASGILGQGELFGIYPEGTRSRDGRLHKGHTGVARLALRAGAPIIPVGLQGTIEVMPAGAKVPTPFRTVRIRFGRAIDVTRHRQDDNRLLLRQITDEVMYEIRALSGQEYVNEYATRRSDRLPAATARIATDGQTRPGGGSGNGGAAPDRPQRSSVDVLRAKR